MHDDYKYLDTVFTGRLEEKKLWKHSDLLENLRKQYDSYAVIEAVVPERSIGISTLVIWITGYGFVISDVARTSSVLRSGPENQPY